MHETPPTTSSASIPDSARDQVLSRRGAPYRPLEASWCYRVFYLERVRSAPVRLPFAFLMWQGRCVLHG
jgi:hypothetical protein